MEGLRLVLARRCDRIVGRGSLKDGGALLVPGYLKTCCVHSL